MNHWTHPHRRSDDLPSLRLIGGRIIDPAQRLDRVANLVIREGKIAGIGNVDNDPVTETIDVSGMLVVPGLIDMHVHLREPSDEVEETIASGCLAAVRGGITGLACLADTKPAIDSRASVEFVTLQASRDGHANVWPVGAVTKGREGKELAEMGGLYEAGAVAFSDSDHAITNAAIMRRALEYSLMFDRPVLSHPEDPELTAGGLINEGDVSAMLGIAGMPAVAEEVQVNRDLRLAAFTGGRLHVQTVSCAGAVEAIRQAKKAGVQVTAEASPPHFCLTDEMLASFDTNCKLNPPLRNRADVDAVLAGLADGTIDVIASGHRPCAPEKKMHELSLAPFGAVGLETLLPVCITTLVDTGVLTWLQLIEKVSLNPARILGKKCGSLQAGLPADVTVIDAAARWVIDPLDFCSIARKTPFAGMPVHGRAELTIVGGIVRYRRGEGVG